MIPTTMSTLMALALNPNLSSDELVELSKQKLDARARMVEKAGKEAQKLDPDQRLEYLSFVIPIIFSI